MEGLIKKIISVLLMLSILMPMSLVKAKAQPVKIFVEQGASANGDGSVERPYATMVEARDAIRLMKKTIIARRAE